MEQYFGSYYFSVFVLFFIAHLVSGNDITELKASEIDESVAKKDLAVVNYYFSQCTSKKSDKFNFKDLAKNAKKSESIAALYKLICDSSDKLCSQLGVTDKNCNIVQIYFDGKLAKTFSGVLKTSDIWQNISSFDYINSKKIKNKEKFDELMNGYEYFTIGFFNEDSEKKDLLLRFIESERFKYRLNFITDENLLDEFGYKNDIITYQPKIFQNKYEETEKAYEGPNDESSLKRFIKNRIAGLCGFRDKRNYGSFDLRPLILIYHDIDFQKNVKDATYWRNRCLKVAQEIKDSGKDIYFAISDKMSNGQELIQFGIGEEENRDTPLVCGLGPDGEKYAMQPEFSPEELKKFAEDVYEERIEEYMISEPIPDKNDGPVEIVVARSYKSLLKQNKDIFIMFYSPDCPNCKKLMPVFEELGKRMKDESGVIIAKMDASTNDVPPAFNVYTVPMTYWISKTDQKNPVLYEGGQRLFDLVTYIAEKATEPLKLWPRQKKESKETKETEEKKNQYERKTEL